MEIMIYILVFLFAIFIQYIVIKNAINDSILKDILYEIRKKSQTKSPPKPTTDNLNSNENWNIEEVGDPEIRKLYESDNLIKQLWLQITVVAVAQLLFFRK